MDSVLDGTLDGVESEDAPEKSDETEDLNTTVPEESYGEEGDSEFGGSLGFQVEPGSGGFFMSMPDDAEDAEAEPMSVPDGMLVDDIFFDDALLDPQNMESMRGLVHEGVAHENTC